MMSSSDVLVVVLLLGLAFVFEGDPDIWDLAIDRIKYELKVSK